MTVNHLSRFIRNDLQGFYPDREIQQFIVIIFEHLLKYTKIDIHLKGNEPISDEIFQQTNDIVLQLKQYRPIQYITGRAHFYNMYFIVNGQVLIPRQETEELVKWIIDDHSGKKVRILDIGTGSGCIAISLAKTLNNAMVEAVDVSPEALSVALKNSVLNEVTINFIKADMLIRQFAPFEKYDIVVSNPPYVRKSERNMMGKNVPGHEPSIALFVSDEDALIFYRVISEFGLKFLKPGGYLYFEINEAFGNEVTALLKQAGYNNVTLRKDINGKDRMVKAVVK